MLDTVSGRPSPPRVCPCFATLVILLCTLCSMINKAWNALKRYSAIWTPDFSITQLWALYLTELNSVNIMTCNKKLEWPDSNRRPLVPKTSALSQTELHSNNQLFSSQGCYPKMLAPHLSLAFYPQQGFCISNSACASLVLQRDLSLKRISSH